MIIETNLCHPKENTVEQILKFSVLADMKLTKQGEFVQKKYKNNPLVDNSVLQFNWIRFRNNTIREKINLKPDLQIHKTQKKFTQP